MYQAFDISLTSIGLLILFTFVVIMVFMASRYHKFKTNEYVIHLRNGKVKSAGLGGKIIKLPLLDDIIVIPTTTRKTILNASEKVLSKEYQDLRIVGILYWKVSNPTVAYNAVVWDPRSSDYVEKVLSTASEAIIRTTAASLEIEKIIRERASIIKIVSDQLYNLTKDWGIVIESLEIVEVEVLDANLKRNMEAVKKVAEEQKARMAAANSKEVYRLRELEVEKMVGVAQEQTNLEIMLQAKKKEISVQTEEKKKMEIDAEAYKTAEILKAQGDAEALRLQKQVKFEAEAEAIRLKMAAQAEGLQKQVDALSSGDERFMAVKLVEILPQIFENINPDKMIVMGEGKSAFNSLANSILPFMELIPSFVQGMKGVYNKSELNGDGVE